MNAITYHGKALVEGPENYFKLTTGVAPSFGFFRMQAEDVEYVLTTQSGAPGTLVLVDGTNTVTLYNVYLVRSTSVSAVEDKICDVVLADERILWQYKYGTADYNTYKTDRQIGSAEFTLENLNTGSEWTFAELITTVKTILGIATLTFTPPTRKPRNVIGKNIPGPCVLQQLLIALQSYLTIDLQVADPTYAVYPIGAAEQSGDLTLITQYANSIHKQRTIRLNPLVQKGLAVKMLSSADPDDAPGRLLTYGSGSATGGTGNHYIPSMYSVFGNEENAAGLATIGNEMAAEYVASFANTWRNTIYAGVLPFKLNRAIHEIQWSSNAQGAFTSIKSFRPREELKGKDLQDMLFTYYKYLLGRCAAPEMEYGDDCDCFDAGKTPKYYTVTFKDIIECTECGIGPWPSDANRTEVLTQDIGLPCVWKKSIGGWDIYLRLKGTCWLLDIAWDDYELSPSHIAAFYCTNTDCVSAGLFNNVLDTCCADVEDCGGGHMRAIGKDGTARIEPGVHI